MLRWRSRCRAGDDGDHNGGLCNAPDPMRQVSPSYSSSLPCHLLACCILPCHYVHLILHTRSSHASEHFSRCPFCNPALLCPPASPSSLFSCAGVKLSRNGPSLAKRPWYSTGRPPVKFRAIWRSFDTPMVNRVSVKASFVAAQHPFQSGPKPILTRSMLSVVRS